MSFYLQSSIMCQEIEITKTLQLEQRLDSNIMEIIKYSEPIEYEYFFVNHLEKNIPCLFGSWLTKDWPARKYWVNEDTTPNTSYLKETFGDCIVPVANCDKKYFNAQKKEGVTLNDYLETWNNKNDFRCLYLKDWHFMKEFPSYAIFNTPCYFASDWLNEYWLTMKNSSDDYRFIYMGPKGSWTPFHADVFGSYSWSVNICGKKQWLLFPSGKEENLKDRFGSLVYDVLCPELRDEKLFPNGVSALSPIEVIQEAGECIFIPSGWHHQVHNMADTISLNHNWINGTNIDVTWKQLLAALSEVEKSISDCNMMEDWTSTCQTILKVHFGMNIYDFVSLLCIISERRLDMYKGCKTETFNGWLLGRNHIIYDIQKLIDVYKCVLNETKPDILLTIDETVKPFKVLERLQSVL